MARQCIILLHYRDEFWPHYYTPSLMCVLVLNISHPLGYLQLLFLAGAIEHPLQQHCSHQGQELYNLLVPPCSCVESYKLVLDLMWIKIFILKSFNSTDMYKYRLVNLPEETRIFCSNTDQSEKQHLQQKFELAIPE